MAEITAQRLPFGLEEYIKSFSDGVAPSDNSKVRIPMNYYRNVQGVNSSAVAQFAHVG